LSLECCTYATDNGSWASTRIKQSCTIALLLRGLFRLLHTYKDRSPVIVTGITLRELIIVVPRYHARRVCDDRTLCVRKSPSVQQELRPCALWVGLQRRFMGDQQSIRVLHGLAEVDFDRLEDEGNAPRAEESIGLSRPANLLADGAYPTYTARLEEANISNIIDVLEGIVISPGYGLFPEASRIKPAIFEIRTTLFCCG